MNPQLSREQEELHLHAVELCRRYHRLEWQIVETLQNIDRTRLYRNLGAASLFQYAVRFLNLSEAVAYNFILVARKSRQIPQLAGAIRSASLSVTKAGRIASVLTPENATELIRFSQTHTKREIEFAVARWNPKAARPERVKVLSEDLVEINLCVTKKTYDLLMRAQSLLAQKIGTHSAAVGEMANTLNKVLEDYCRRHDSVQKAERFEQRKVKRARQLCPGKVGQNFRRTPLTARQKHEVVMRDGGRCTHLDQQGRRCGNDQWVQIHHIRPVHLGGGNEPQNLTTLCSVHHDLAHQLTLSLEGQVTWLRSPLARYG